MNNVDVSVRTHRLRRRRRQDSRADHCNNTYKTEWWNIGGPNTMLPKCVESFLCWSLALSCLSISGYHYILENYIMTLRMTSPPSYPKIVPDFLLYPIRCCIYRMWKPKDRMDEEFQKESTTVSSKSSVFDDTCDTVLPHTQLQSFPCWIPLMTYSRAELQRGTPYDRYIQLVQVLHSINPEYLMRRNTNNNNNTDRDNHDVIQCTLSDDALVQLIRNNEIVRRLVSLALRPPLSSSSSLSMYYRHASMTSNEKDVRQQPFGQQLIRIWSHLLSLPPIQRLHDSTTQTTSKRMTIALIIPCYHETINDIIDKLKYALRNCQQPQQVQVRLVMAGKNAIIDRHHLQSTMHNLDNECYSSHNNTITANDNNNNVHQDVGTSNHHQWGNVQVIEFSEESGRGPCLNYGAVYKSRTDHHHEQNDDSDDDDNDNNILVYTFCHSDTRLPYHWDQTLIHTLYPPPVVAVDQYIQSNIHGTTKSSRSNVKRINACAYRFGIDTTGLRNSRIRHHLHTNNHHHSHPHNNNNNGNNVYYPPGIHAIEVTANLRCTFWSLPYGDQCISMRKDDFHYLGGFPHQCLMEDYELITLLRKRMKLLPLFRMDNTTYGNDHNNSHPSVEEETIQILSGPPVLCSPRRWQKFGVFYVTYTNSRLVQLYNQKNRRRDNNNSMSSPEEIYQLYYGQTLDVIAPKSPWEIELEQILNSNKQ